MLRQIDQIAIRVGDTVFGFAIRWSFLNIGSGTQPFAYRFQFLDVVHFDAEMVQPFFIVRPLLNNRETK